MTGQVRELRLGDIISRIRAKKKQYTAWLIGIPTILFALTFFITPQYTATISLATTEDEQSAGLSQIIGRQLGVLSNFAGLSALGGRKSVEENLTIVRSRVFLESFIEDHDLLPILYPDIWDADANDWVEPTWLRKILFEVSQFMGDQEQELTGKPSMPKAVEDMQLLQRVVLNVETQLVSVSLKLQEAGLAARILNMMIEDVNELIRQRKIKKTESAISFLNSELQNTTNADLRAAIVSLISLQLNEQMIASVSDDYAFKVLDPATPPLERSWPSRRLFLVLGLLAAIVGIMTFEFLKMALEESQDD